MARVAFLTIVIHGALLRSCLSWNQVSKRNTHRWGNNINGRTFVSHARLFSAPSANHDDVIDETVADEEDLSTYSPGIPAGFFVVQQYTMPDDAFDLSSIAAADIERLSLTPENVTVPVALMILDPQEFQSFSKARKVCRKANALVHRGPLKDEVFDLDNCFIGRVGDRVYPGDVIGKQVRMGSGDAYPTVNQKQPFELPIVYEDDYFAIVNKPAGVVVYAVRGGGHGMMTMRCCLPYVLTPPKVGTYSILRRPQPVHRLDKPTSGLLLVAKTKPAMVHLSRQFAERKVKKTYTAIVNGIPFESQKLAVSSQDAFDMGVDVDPESDAMWQLIDFTLEEKEAITLWRSQQYADSLKANDKTLTLVELRPKTGRYHQLRRHMAWVCETPLVGDSEYDGGGDAMSLRERGLFLCSNRVSMEHPYFNTDHGREIWNNMSEEERFGSGMVFQEENDGRIMVTASIDLPTKFENFLLREQQRSDKFRSEDDT